MQAIKSIQPHALQPAGLQGTEPNGLHGRGYPGSWFVNAGKFCPARPGNGRRRLGQGIGQNTAGPGQARQEALPLTVPGCLAWWAR